jgi:hypothetical protein
MDQFDPQIPQLIEGEVTNVAVLESSSGHCGAEPGARPHATVRGAGRLEGVRGLVPLWLAALDQDFVVSVYAEGMGASPEVRLGTATKDKNDFTACAGNNRQEYSVRSRSRPF